MVVQPLVALRGEVMKSKPQQDMERMRCFARDQFWITMVIRYYSGTFMYVKQYQESKVGRRYRKACCQSACRRRKPRLDASGMRRKAVVGGLAALG